MYFSQIHPWEYVEEKACISYSLQRRTGLQLDEINPFNLHPIQKKTKNIVK